MMHKKLLQRLSEFFDMDARARAQNKEDINELLSRLKQKEVDLKLKLEITTDEEERNEMVQKIDLVHRQRKKGVAMLKELMSDD